MPIHIWYDAVSFTNAASSSENKAIYNRLAHSNNLNLHVLIISCWGNYSFPPKKREFPAEETVVSSAGNCSFQSKELRGNCNKLSTKPLEHFHTFHLFNRKTYLKRRRQRISRLIVFTLSIEFIPKINRIFVLWFKTL